MRINLHNFIRTVIFASNATFRPTTATAHRAFSASRAPAPLRSMQIPIFGALFGSSSSSSAKKMDYPVKKTEAEWKEELGGSKTFGLTPYDVLRNAHTEPPGPTSQYNKHYAPGTYFCRGCSAPLYTSDTKFDSGCGWPAFFDAVPGAVTRHTDPDGSRTEIVCSSCGGHLGHVFKGERFGNPIDERHCVNSLSLRFRDEEEGGKKEESKV
ncbi:putative methionine-R-sulfoxide reductase SelR [Aulographum hederae CBS 113979]|uniref:Putative methionine-R-sulfoxide reductase SelR n=1 Tax=Aulographum hederae CBS 113979 TaxID=1176131 RepID=A0A6G1GVS5_9PEZI|nr:putative methionine-R-sulfoxide reductase SelR [Aulographum hederae CBS 113979]